VYQIHRPPIRSPFRPSKPDVSSGQFVPFPLCNLFFSAPSHSSSPSYSWYSPFLCATLNGAFWRDLVVLVRIHPTMPYILSVRFPTHMMLSSYPFFPFGHIFFMRMTPEPKPVPPPNPPGCYHSERLCTFLQPPTIESETGSLLFRTVAFFLSTWFFGSYD